MTPPTLSGLVRQYRALSLLSGLAIGLRTTIDLFALSGLEPDIHGFRSAAVGLLFAGMLVGEVAGGLSASRGRLDLVVSAAAAFLMAWGVVFAAAMSSKTAWPLLAGTALAGCGIGLMHVGLDAWLLSAYRAATRTEATDEVLNSGWLLYNLGYLVGSAAAFPLLCPSLGWTGDLIDGQRRPLPATVDAFALWPGLAVALVAILIVVCRPRAEGLRQDREDGPPVGYRRLLAASGAMWALFAVGGAVAFIIQFVDNFAPSLIIAGSTLGRMTLNVTVFNAIVLLFVGGVEWRMRCGSTLQAMSEQRRYRFIASHLAVAGALIVGVLAYRILGGPSDGDGVEVAVAVGVTHGVLCVLPPIIKKAVAHFVPDGERAAAFSMLGVFKRVPAMFLSGLLVFVPTPGNDGPLLLGLLLLVCVGSLGVTGLVAARRRLTARGGVT